MNIKPYLKRNSIFPSIVAILSMINLFNQLTYLNVFSAVTSLIGIIGVILFFINNKGYKILFYIWILVQMVSIASIYDDYTLGARVTKPIWYTLQADVNFHFSLAYQWGVIQFNFVSVFYLIIFRALRVSKLKGVVLSFSKLKEESHFGDSLPAHGTVIDILKVGGEKEWLLVQLNKPVSYEAKKINTVLVKRKDEEIIKPKQEGQIVYFRLVEDVDTVYSVDRVAQFPLVEWVLCK